MWPHKLQVHVTIKIHVARDGQKLENVSRKTDHGCWITAVKHAKVGNYNKVPYVSCYFIFLTQRFVGLLEQYINDF